MYIGYFDEFGHNGAYISRDDKAYKTHPVFGLGGIVLPAESVRSFSGQFKRMKEHYLASEIKAKVTNQNKDVNHWEKKGSALLTTRNIEQYPEVRTLINRTLRAVKRLNGFVCFYGQQKEIGPPEQSNETNRSRYDHTMKQLVQRLDHDMPENSQLLMILDEQGNKERLEVYAGASAFMFSNASGQRLIEPPMQVESHLYQTVQAADWICALLGRISAYKFDPGFLEYQWSCRYFGDKLSDVTSSDSKIRGLARDEPRSNLYPRFLGNFARCFAPYAASALKTKS